MLTMVPETECWIIAPIRQTGSACCRVSLFRCL